MQGHLDTEESEVNKKIRKNEVENKKLEAVRAKLLSIKNLRRFAKKYDLQIIIIPSMRTPINTIEHASSFFDKETIIVKNVDKKAYLSALSISEFLVITCDSTSMISEAALTGKPIYVAQIQSKKDDYRFRQFRKLFTKLNIIRNLEDKLEVWNYEKLDETNRVANIIKKKI